MPEIGGGHAGRASRRGGSERSVACAGPRDHAPWAAAKRHCTGRAGVSVDRWGLYTWTLGKHGDTQLPPALLRRSDARAGTLRPPGRSPEDARTRGRGKVTGTPVPWGSADGREGEHRVRGQASEGEGLPGSTSSAAGRPLPVADDATRMGHAGHAAGRAGEAREPAAARGMPVRCRPGRRKGRPWLDRASVTSPADVLEPIPVGRRRIYGVVELLIRNQCEHRSVPLASGAPSPGGCPASGSGEQPPAEVGVVAGADVLPDVGAGCLPGAGAVVAEDLGDVGGPVLHQVVDGQVPPGVDTVLIVLLRGVEQGAEVVRLPGGLTGCPGVVPAEVAVGDVLGQALDPPQGGWRCWRSSRRTC